MTAQILRLERRWNNRKDIENELLDGKFYLDIYHYTYELTRVHNLSISGMGLILPVEIPAKKEIVLRFQSKEFDVFLGGKVMWCEKNAGLDVESRDEGYRLGIEFDTENHGNLVMYFMALRKYLDEFNQ